uniref:Fibronectin type-III domain-containing protein n=1 Tax=Macrostomum lignano TaxID=282301 RepID=A0A1I8F503_9PLAT
PSRIRFEVFGSWLRIRLISKSPGTRCWQRRLLSGALTLHWDTRVAFAVECGLWKLYEALRDLTLQSEQAVQRHLLAAKRGPSPAGPPAPTLPPAGTVLSDFGQSRPAMLSLRTPSARPNRRPIEFHRCGASSGAQLTWLPPPLRSQWTPGWLPDRYRELPAESDVSATASVKIADIGDDDDESIVDGRRLTHRLAGTEAVETLRCSSGPGTVNGTGRFTAGWCSAPCPVPTDYGLLDLRDQNTSRSFTETCRCRRRSESGQGCDRHRQAGLHPAVLDATVCPGDPDKYVITMAASCPRRGWLAKSPATQDAYQIRNLVPNQYYFITICGHQRRSPGGDATARENQSGDP